jgi:hypothetical protein
LHSSLGQNLLKWVSQRIFNSFIGLKLGKHHFEYQISNAFFEIFDYNEYENSDIKVNVVLEKKHMLEVSFKHKGINVPCDVTGRFWFADKGKMNLIVRFGEEYNDDNEELLILPLVSLR